MKRTLHAPLPHTGKRTPFGDGMAIITFADESVVVLEVPQRIVNEQPMFLTLGTYTLRSGHLMFFYFKPTDKLDSLVATIRGRGGRQKAANVRVVAPPSYVGNAHLASTEVRA